PVVRAGRLVRLLSFAALAPRLVARERWDAVVGFGRTPRQDMVRVGGGTHRSYLARMEAAGLRRRWRGPYHRAVLRLETRAFAPGAYRRVLAVSARVRDEVAADYRVPRERIRVLYNGVDLERFHPARRATLGPAARRALGLADGERVCAAIGSGFARKGFDLLLRLWREAPPRDTALVLVGDDERLASYRRQAEALGRRVRVTGPRPDVEAVLAAADVTCLPSRQEAFGNVVLEACAAGVPVVPTRRAGPGPLPPPRPAPRLGRPRRRPRARDSRRRRPRSPPHAPRLPHREAPAQGGRRPHRDRRRHAVGEALRGLRVAGRAREPRADLTRLRGVGGRGRPRRARLCHPGADRRDRVPARRPA